MAKLVTSVITIIVALGIALGVAQWLGDGSEVFTRDWFSSSTEKMDQLRMTGEEIGENLPAPDSFDLPKLEDLAPINGDGQK